MRHKIQINFNDRTKRLIISDIEKDQFKVIGGDEAQRLFDDITTTLKSQVSFPATSRDYDGPVQGTRSETPVERNQQVSIQ